VNERVAPQERRGEAPSRRGHRSLPGRLLASLRLWIVLATVVGLLLPNLFVWQWNDAASERRALAHLGQDLDKLADILAAAMRDSLWQVSPELGRPILQAMFRDERLVSVSVVETSAGKPFLEIYRSVSATAPSLTATRQINYEGREIGSLSVTLSAGPALARNHEENEATVIRLAISALISVTLVLLVFHFRLLLPVMRLQADLRRLARGEAAPRDTAWAGTEELRPLAEGIAKARRMQAAMRLRARREPPTRWPENDSRAGAAE
jgi:hypothetical protein